MVTTWNKFCFNTGYVEVSISMPGSPQVPGLWPGLFTPFFLFVSGWTRYLNHRSLVPGKSGEWLQWLLALTC